MKTKSLLMLLLMLTGFCMAKAEIVELGASGGTETTDKYLPTYTYYKYSLTQQIYKPYEIDFVGNIASVAFWNTGDARTRTIDLYLVAPNKTSFSSGADWIPFTEADKMFSGEVTFASGEWTWINFPLGKRFNRKASDNLAVIMVDRTGGYVNGTVPFKAYTADRQALEVHRDDAAFTPDGLSGYSGTVLDVKSQIRLSGSDDGFTIGPSRSECLPTDLEMEYSFTEQIYTKEEIGKSGTIKSLAFYSKTASGTRNIDLWLGTTAKQTFSGNYDWLKSSQTGAVKVFSGNVAFTPGEWTTITFSTPFNYNGTSNLLVITDDNTGTDMGEQWFYTYEGTGQALTTGGTANSFNPATIPSDCYGSLEKVKNRIKLDIEEGGSSESEFVQIGDGEDKNYAMPLNMYYNYSLSQQIYTAAEIGKAGTITSIAFDYAHTQAFSMNGVQVYLKNVSKEVFDDDHDMVAVSESDMVWEGTFSAEGAGWATINLNSPFKYDGKSNLLVCLYDPTHGFLSSAHTFMQTSTEVKRAITYWSDSEAPDLENITVYSQGAARPDFRSNIRLDIEGGSDPEPTVIEIGDGGTNTDNTLPTYSFYKFSLSQQIYTPGEVGGAKPLTSVSFFNGGDEKTRNMDIYLVHTSKKTFAHITDWVSFSEADKVFSGEVTFVAGDWTQIAFFNAFEYNGTDNLVLIVDDNSGEESAGMECRVFDAHAQAIHIYSDDTNFDAAGLGDYNGTTLTLKNQIRFNETGIDNSPRVINLAASDIAYESATITWEGGGSLWNLNYKTADESEWTLVEGLTVQSYELTGLDQATSYDVRVRVDYSDGSYSSDWKTIQFTTLEKYARPTDLVLVYVLPHMAKIKWTENGTATAWQIWVNGDIIDANKNPFILTGLADDNYYEIGVRSVYGEEEFSLWSSAVTFDTPVANETPYDLAVNNVTPTSATVKWNGNSNSYELRYRKAPVLGTPTFFEDFDGAGGNLPDGWTTIDADGDGYTWIPASGAPGVYLKESGNLTGLGHNDSQDFVVSGSYTNATEVALTPDNYLVLPQMTLGGTLVFYACAQDEDYSNEHFGVAVSTTGNTDAADFTTIDEWTLKADGTGSKSSRRKAQGLWGRFEVDLSAYAGQQGYVAIRHFDCTDQFVLNIDDIGIYSDAEIDDWTVVETSEKTCTIYGLEPDTDYEYQVASFMSGEDSAESGIFQFTTLPNNPVPFDIAIDPAPTSATFSWTGYSDSYTIEYRIPAPEAASFFDDFENGLDEKGWTVYTLGEAPAEGGWFTYETSVPHSGSYVASAWSYRDEAYNANNWLVTPQLDLGGKLKFWTQSDASSWLDSYEVLLSTTDNATENFTVELRPMQEAPDSWTEVSIDLSAYAGLKGYIAIHHVSNNQYGLLIDDFGLYFPTGAAGNWQYVWAAGTTCKLMGLKKNTMYEYRITGSKSGEPDATSDIATFTTTSDAIELELALTPPEAEDNMTKISENNGAYANVTLNTGTITMPEGTWFSFCLPFDLIVEDSPFKGTDVRIVEDARLEGTCVILDCLTPMTRVSAGMPFIVRWPGEYFLTDPVFQGVVIKNASNDCDFLGGDVYVNGTYSFVTYNQDDPNFYYLYYDPILRNMERGHNVRAFSGYFYFSNNLLNVADTFILNTGDNEDQITGISPLVGTEEGTEVIYKQGSTIVNLAGQRLAKKQKGINIVNGRKVLVK